MTKLLTKLGLLFLVFSLSFLGVTALLDYICHHNGYYVEAANITTVLED